MAESTPSRVARLEERLTSMQADVTDIRTDMKSQNEKLDRLLAVDNQRKGARVMAKALVGVGSGSGVVALVGWLLEHIKP